MNKLLLLGALIPAAAWAGGYTFIGELSHRFHIAQHVITFCVVGILFLLIGVIYRSKSSSVKNTAIPDRGITFRNMVEALGQFVYNLARNIMGEEQAKRYYSVIVLLFSFIFSLFLIKLEKMKPDNLFFIPNSTILFDFSKSISFGILT